MKFVNRLRFITTATTAATITYSTGVAGFRTLAKAISDGKLAVGDTNVPFVTEDGSGNWEASYYTVTDSVTLTRTAIADSSNGGNAVTFDTGPKTVYCEAFSHHLNTGLANADDPGFDIVLCCGQSNMVGAGAIVANMDIADPRVFQFGSYPSDTATYQKIVTGVDPLKHPFDTTVGVGPGSWFSKTYAGMIPSNRKVLLVPVAQGSQALVYAGGADVTWAPGNPGGTLFEMAIAQANAAIAAAQLLYPNSRYVGAIWLQGEKDGDWTIATATYTAAMKTLIAGFRSRITGASSSWFIIGGMVQEAINTRTGYAGIRDAHIKTAAETAKCAYVPSISGYQNGDNLHYNAQGARMMGCAMAAAVPAAKLATGVVVPATAMTLTGPSTGVVSQASGTFAVGANGSLSGTVNWTASDNGGGGTFSATTGTTPGSFTYTPGSTGAKTISITNNGGLSNPANITYTVSAAPAQTITVNNPGAQTVGSAFNVTGTYANGTPAALDYRLSDDTAGVWAQVATATISGGNFSFSQTPTSTSTGRTISVRDRTTQVSGTSVSYVVNAAGAASTSLQFGQLARMSETNNAAPYAYLAGGTANYDGSALGGTSLLSLAGDGSVTITVGAGFASGKPMLSIKSQTTTVSCTALSYVLFADTAGYTKFSGAAGTAGTTGIIPAAGDLMRMTRTGTTILAHVSKDGGTNWTLIYTWTGVPAGTMYAQILAQSVSTVAGAITSTASTGFA